LLFSVCRRGLLEKLMPLISSEFSVRCCFQVDEAKTGCKASLFAQDTRWTAMTGIEAIKRCEIRAVKAESPRELMDFFSHDRRESQTAPEVSQPSR
jgi:hypothetical protein